MTPMIEELEANDCATVEAFDGSSCVSPCWSVILTLFFLLAFHRARLNCAQCSWSLPIEPAGPVIGASMPSCTPFEHDAVAVEETWCVAGRAAAAATTARVA